MTDEEKIQDRNRLQGLTPVRKKKAKKKKKKCCVRVWTNFIGLILHYFKGLL
jgi:hypothetical protein